MGTLRVDRVFRLHSTGEVRAAGLSGMSRPPWNCIAVRLHGVLRREELS